jgi:outer membrane protein TolC
MKTLNPSPVSSELSTSPYLLGILALFFTGLLLQSAEPWTLPQAIQCALTNNPDTRLAEQRILAAQAGLQQAKAAFSPQLQFQSSYLRTDNPMLVFGSILNQQAYSSTLDFNHVPDADNLNVKGLVTMPLYAGGRNAAGRDAAKANTQSAEQNAEAVRNALAFEAARSFFNVNKTREFIHATEASVRAYETNLSIANKRFSAGTLLKNEALDVEVRLAQAREEWARAKNSHQLALHSLKNLLGIDQGDFAVADSAPAMTAPDSGDFSRRPELAAYRHRQQAAEAEVRKAKSGHLPRLNAFASGDYDYGWKFDGDGESYTAGLMLQWDWWDGQLTRAKVQESRAGLQSAREELRKVQLALSLEVEQARLALNEANERLLVTDKAVAQAGESVDLTRARFEQGLALATQLIDAESALTTARVRRAEAEADRNIATAAVRKALGLTQLDSPLMQK